MGTAYITLLKYYHEINATLSLNVAYLRKGHIKWNIQIILLTEIQGYEAFTVNSLCSTLKQESNIKSAFTERLATHDLLQVVFMFQTPGINNEQYF